MVGWVCYIPQQGSAVSWCQSVWPLHKQDAFRPTGCDIVNQRSCHCMCLKSFSMMYKCRHIQVWTPHSSQRTDTLLKILVSSVVLIQRREKKLLAALPASPWSAPGNATDHQFYCNRLSNQLSSGSKTPAQQQTQVAKPHLASRNSFWGACWS